MHNKSLTNRSNGEKYYAVFPLVERYKASDTL
jgi:hypothetical protein